MDGRIILDAPPGSRIYSVEIDDWITVGYDPDDNEIEEAVIVELDYSPTDPDVGIMEDSFDVTRVRYSGQGFAVGTVEPRLITADMRQTWEERATEFVAEFMEGERDAALEAKLDARRDGD